MCVEKEQKKRISFDAFIVFCHRKSSVEKRVRSNKFLSFSVNKLAAYSDAYIKVLSWKNGSKMWEEVRKINQCAWKMVVDLAWCENQQALFMSVHRFPLCINLYEFDAVTTHTGTIHAQHTLIRPQQKKLYWTNSGKLLDSILRVCFPSFFAFFYSAHWLHKVMRNNELSVRSKEMVLCLFLISNFFIF